MGRRLIALGSADAELEIVEALESAKHPDLGKDAGVIAGVDALGVIVSSGLSTDVDAVIDFSVPAGAEAITTACVERGTPLVMATTGLSDAQRQTITEAAARIPVLWAPNMSLAVNLTMKLAETAAAYVLVASALVKRLLIVVDKNDLGVLRLAKGSQFSSKWTEASEVDRAAYLR